MKAALLIALKNIKSYKLSSLGRSLFLVIFSFVVISTLMFTIAITNSISDIFNSRYSGNTVIVSADESELANISKTQYVNDAVLVPTSTFASGSAKIEDMGSFFITCRIHKAKDISAMIPELYFREFKNKTNEDFILTGRLPQNNKELIIDSRYLDSLQVDDYSMVLGKKISIYHLFVDNTHSGINSATIVGVYSGSFLEIAAYASNKTDAYCFMVDNSASASGKMMAFCDFENIDKLGRILKERYGEPNVKAEAITSFALDELINISSFIKKVLLLVSIVIGMVYIVVQIIMVTNYLNEKQPFVSAISAFGLKKENLVLIFIFEYLILLIIPFALSCGLSVIFTKTLTHYASVLSGITFNTTFSPFPIIIAFVVILVISLISILISVYLLKPKKNE